ncbi:MAG: hypothetical protein AMXMBFR13_09470 [Phycisphaerae bacterium]
MIVGTRWSRWIPVCGILVGLSLPLRAQETALAPLCTEIVTEVDVALSVPEVLDVTSVLRSASPEKRHSLREALHERLARAQSPRALVQTCVMLRAAPSEQTIALLAGRLALADAETASAICEGLHRIAPVTPMRPEIAAGALAALDVRLRDPRSSTVLMDRAVLAAGSFGTGGFDLLMKVRDDQRVPRRVLNVFYTALSQTRDPRALPVLRAVVSDTSTPEGRRIQAVHAIGQLFASDEQVKPIVVDAAERVACATLLRGLLETASDQLFSVSLKALKHVENIRESAPLQQWTRASLLSASHERREAALDVLYQSGLPLDGPTIELIRGFSQSNELPPSIQAAAQAVLDERQLTVALSK